MAQWCQSRLQKEEALSPRDIWQYLEMTVYHSSEGNPTGFWAWNQRFFSTSYDAQDNPLQPRMSQPKVYSAEVDKLCSI